MKTLPIILPALLLAACGGTSITAPSGPTFEEFAFVDPDAAADQKFGINAVELSNGNIAVRSLNSHLGAVYIYNPLTQALVASIYGDNAADNLGSTSLTALDNGNLIISSASDDVNGITNSGSVMLIDGTSGAQIGSTISGDDSSDSIGSSSITVLANGNFVVASESDTVNGVNNAGSVMLFNGATGAQIGAAITGDNPFDNYGDGGGNGSVTELTNGNYVIAAPNDTVGGVGFAGSVLLVDGTTGAQIGTSITGDDFSDQMGSGKVFPLDNGNYVISSPFNDVAGVVDGGSATLVNGATGAQILTAMLGDNTDDKISLGGILPLANDEFMVLSTLDDVAGVSDAGSVRYFNADTGHQIGFQHNGARPDDYFGSGSPAIQLTNGNIVITSSRTDSFSDTDVGNIRLINGVTKSTIQSTTLSQADAKLGSGGVKDLKNGNFVVVSQFHDSSTLTNVGSVMVFDGTTGAQVGSTFYGDNSSDLLGESGVTVLDNGNFVVASRFDGVNSVLNAGSAMLFDGLTGAQIGTAIAGDNTNDRIGTNGVIALTGNNNYVISSSVDSVNGMTDAGSVILVDGTTGAQIGTATVGDDVGDRYGNKGTYTTTGVIPLSNGNYLLGSEYNDDNGITDVGLVQYKLGQ